MTKNATKNPDTAPRPPTAEERQQLTQLLTDDQGLEPGDASLTVANAYIAVFDDYVTGSPGYFGKVMTVVWDGSPTFYQTFTWKNKRLVAEPCESNDTISHHLTFTEKEELISAIDEAQNVLTETFDREVDTVEPDHTDLIANAKATEALTTAKALLTGNDKERTEAKARYQRLAQGESLVRW